MTEMEALLAAIIVKADDPETAAKAIVAAGLCSVHDLEHELGRLWEVAGPRSRGANVDRCSIHIRWRPDRAYVRASRWDGTDRHLGAAIAALTAEAHADQQHRGTTP